MLKILFAFLVLVHGLIHCMGFAKAFGYADLKQLTLPVSKTAGAAWLLAAFLFVLAGVMYLLKKESWWIPAWPAILISMVVILASWKDAKWGSLANGIILAVSLAAWGLQRFEAGYRREAKELLAGTVRHQPELLTEADLLPLPPPVQRYIRYTGALGKPKLKNMRVVWEGEMREKGKDFFSFTAEQTSFFDEPARLFFMKGRMFGMTIPGFHRYVRGKASMDIRFAGRWSLVKESGPVMDKTETVTFFNDLCLLAPACLIDPRIQWESADSLNVRAFFRNGDIFVSALLSFHADGRLLDFVSNDRTSIRDKKELPFSTPVHAYREYGGRKIVSAGDAVWHYPGEVFVYGRFRLREIQYNLESD